MKAEDIKNETNGLKQQEGGPYKLALEKINDGDLIGKGVVGQPEVPGIPAIEMQYKVEEIVRDVAIPKINEIVDEFGSVDENMENLERSIRSEVGRVREDLNGFSDEMGEEMSDFRQKFAGMNAEVQNIPNSYVGKAEFSEIEQKVVAFPENYASKEELREIVSSGGHPVTSVFGRLGDIRPQQGDYTPEQVGAAPAIHSHSKDEIRDFPESMPASDVYPWAKQSTKPYYSYDEVGAEPSGAAALALLGHANDSSAHSSLFSGKQNKPISITGSGAINVTLQDNCEYSYAGVSSISMTGTDGEAHGFVVFGNPVGNISISGTKAGDDIFNAKANETWEFSCFKNKFIWKNWGDM